jgi:hypothetical protein
MHYSRQRPRVASTGRISVRLAIWQRDLFIASNVIPKDLAHMLHRTPVRAGKLSIRITREFLDELIAVASKSRAPEGRTEREIVTLLRYLETLEDRFEPSEKPDEGGFDDNEKEPPAAG